MSSARTRQTGRTLSRFPTSAALAALLAAALGSVGCSREGTSESQFRATDGNKAYLLWYWGLQVKDQPGLSPAVKAALEREENRTKVFSCWYRTELPLDNLRDIRATLEANRAITAEQVNAAFFASNVTYRPLTKHFIDCGAFAAEAQAKARAVNRDDTRDFSSICRTEYATNGSLSPVSPTPVPTTASPSSLPDGTLIALREEPQTNLVGLSQILGGAFGFGCIAKIGGLCRNSSDSQNLQNGGQLIASVFTGDQNKLRAVSGATAAVSASRDPDGRLNLGDLAMGLAGQPDVMGEVLRPFFKPGANATEDQVKKANERRTSAANLFGSLFGKRERSPVTVNIGGTPIRANIDGATLFGSAFRKKATNQANEIDTIRNGGQTPGQQPPNGTTSTNASTPAQGPMKGDMDQAHPRVTIDQFKAINNHAFAMGQKPLGFFSAEDVAQGMGVCPDLK